MSSNPPPTPQSTTPSTTTPINSGLSHSNPIRTISSPTGLHGKGLTVAASSSRSKPGGGGNAAGLPPNTAIQVNVKNPLHHPSKSTTMNTVSSSNSNNNSVSIANQLSGGAGVTTSKSSATIEAIAAAALRDVPSTLDRPSVSDPLMNPPPAPAPPAPALVPPPMMAPPTLVPPRNTPISETSVTTTKKSSTSTAKAVFRKIKSSTDGSNSNSSSTSSSSKKITKKISSSIAKTLNSSKLSSEDQSSSSQQQQQQQQPPLSLEDETNQFLSPNPLHPPPMQSSEHALITIQNLVLRRAWGDVMHFSGDYLNSLSFSYHYYYSELKQCGSSNSGTKSTTSSGGGSSHTAPSSQDPDSTSRIQMETCHLIAYRMQAMLKLRRYNDLEREVQSLNLLRCRFVYPSQTKDGTFTIQSIDDTNATEYYLPVWVPFGLKLLAIQSLLFTDSQNPQNCVDLLHIMKYELEQEEEKENITKKTTSVDSSSVNDLQYGFVQKWRYRVDMALCKAFVRMQEWRMALEVLDSMISKDSSSSHLETAVTLHVEELWNEKKEEFANQKGMDKSVILKLFQSALRVELLSRQIHILLQMGAIPQAQALQDLAQVDYSTFHDITSWKIIPLSGMDQFIRSTRLLQRTATQIYLNEGLLLFSQGKYEDAMEQFQSAVTSQRSNDGSNTMTATTMSATSSSSQQQETYDHHSHLLSTGIIDSLDQNDDPNLITHAMNNFALCSLYTCQVNAAVSAMEALIKENPTLYLTEVLVFNICTLYELCADVAGSGRKKKVLQSVAKRFFLHDIGMENFRIGG